MDNNQMRIFKQALQESDKKGNDMSVTDWAMSVGLMLNYGHGYEWKNFTKIEAIDRIEELAEWMDGKILECK